MYLILVMGKKKAVLIIFVFAALLTAIFAVSAFGDEKEAVIVIDPGHGGMDAGCVAEDKTREEELNLEIAKKIAEKLSEKGYCVILTRQDSASPVSGRFIKRLDMEYRKKLRDDSKTALFISVHCNHFKNPKYCGAQTVYTSENEKNESLAKTILDSIKQSADEKNTRSPMKTDKIYILKGCRCPAVLIECGFLSNEEELARLKDDGYQKKLAEAVASGCDAVFNN